MLDSTGSKGRSKKAREGERKGGKEGKKREGKEFKSNIPTEHYEGEQHALQGCGGF